MKALRQAVWLLALPAVVCAQPVETALAPQAPAVSAPSPSAVALALRAEIQALSPLAGSPALPEALQDRLATPASPAQALACRYLASSLESDAALPLVQSFVLRSRAPEAARINAELSKLAAPYRADPRLRAELVEAAGLRITDPDKLQSSLDALFEKSSSRGIPSSAVFASPARAAAQAPSDIPRLGPTIADLGDRPLTTARIGSFHENDPAKIIIMHEPSSELNLANAHWESALFTGPVDWKGASAEHANYRAALEREGAQVFLVREVLLAGTIDKNGKPKPGPALTSLRLFAGQFLHYDTSALAREFAALKRYAAQLPPGDDRDEVEGKLAEIAPKLTAEGQERYKSEVLDNLAPEALVDVILNQPRVKLHLQSRKTKGAFYVGLSQKMSFQPLMNLYFARDQQITTHKGVVINKMSFDQRKPEPKVMKFVFQKLGIPIVAELKDGTMDGGDYIPAGDLVFQGVGLRTTLGAVKQLMREDAYGAGEVAVVVDAHDQNMDRMHLDTVFNVLSDDKVLALDDLFKDPKKKRVVDLYRRTDKDHGATGRYAKVEQGVDFETFLKERGFRVATVSHQDQLHYALNFLNVGEGRVLTPYGDKQYLKKLRSLGVDAEYVPMKCLTDGYGAAHCMTQVISREPRL